MLFVRSCYKKKSPDTQSAFFLTRQLSAPALIYEEEMEFPKTLAEQILKTAAGRHETAVNPFLEGLL